LDSARLRFAARSTRLQIDLVSLSKACGPKVGQRRDLSIGGNCLISSGPVAPRQGYEVQPIALTEAKWKTMKRVLSVGQCGFDHGSISQFLEGHFEVEVSAAATANAALALLRKQPFDLVLVNRQFDADGSEGLDFIQTLKADAGLTAQPVMLVTNFPEYDRQAVALGAVGGFGKGQIGSPAVVRRLEPFLK